MASAINSISPLSLNTKITNQTNDQGSGSDFLSILKDTIGEVNQDQKNADNALGEIASGQVKDLHQAAISIDKAEISMKVMLEVRNKALNAYKEILKTQM
jgi:flagellar hook-basal body complex protein FliE